MNRERVWAALLIGVFGMLATAHSLIPIFEGPDEIEHYRYVRYLVENRELPHPAGLERGQYHQAPLYYVLAAPVLALVDDADFERIAQNENPYFGVNFNVPGNDNKTIFIHTAAERFPYTESGTARAVHLMRLLSVACGLVTMVAAYGAFCLLWPGRTALRLTALGLLATWNQFIYMSSVVNNDALLMALATVCLYLLLWAVRQGPSWRWAGLFGVALGLALLTKSSALALGFFIAFVVVTQPRFWRYAPLVLLISFGMAGFWYARNWLLVGDPTGIAGMAETWSSEMIMPDGSTDWQVGLARSGYAYQTAWNRLGSGAISLPPEVYRAFDVVVAVAVAGLVFALVRHLLRGGRWYRTRIEQAAATLTVFTLIWLPLLVYFAGRAYSGNQGRYLLTAVAGWAALLAWGLLAWVPRRYERVAGAVIVLVALGTAAVTYAGYVLPAYRPLPTQTTLNEPRFRYGDVAELMAVEWGDNTVGDLEDTATVTLHWRALRPTQGELLTYVHSLDSETIRRDSYPGTGTLRSSEWQVGQQWAERFVLRRAEGTPRQQQVTLVAGLYDPQADAPLPAFGPGGEEVLPTVGTLAVQGEPGTLEAAYVFGERIALAEPEVTADELCFAWSALESVGDYSAYVHVLGASGEIVAQQDHQPDGDGYVTGLWLPGEVVTYCVPRPAGDGEIVMGLYDPATGERLPVRMADGAALPSVQLAD